MRGWSTLCAVHFGKLLTSLSVKCPAAATARSRSLINVYCLAPANLSELIGVVHRNVVQLLSRAVADSESALFYPLERTEFNAELWQTSAELLVLFDFSGVIPESVTEFHRELTLVSQFLADGGRVLLLLKKPDRLPESSVTSLGYLLWSTQPVTRPLCTNSWRWDICDPDRLNFDKSTNESPFASRKLIGYLTTHSDHTVLSGKLVVTSIDNLECKYDCLIESLELLGIKRRAHLTNGHGDKTVQLHEDESPCPPVLHCLVSENSPNVGNPYTDYLDTLDLLYAASDNLAGLDHGTKATLRSYHDVDQLPSGFAWSDYTSALSTRTLGRTVLWTESLGSSWEFCEDLFAKLPVDSGLVVVSNRQTRAKGRGGNRWITPPGQAAFTFHLTLTKPEAVEADVQTSFMQYVTCMQHLVALSVVLAFKQLVCERLGVVCNLQSGLDTSEEFLLVSFLQVAVVCFRCLALHNPLVPGATKVDRSESSDIHSRPVAGKLGGILTRCTMTDPNCVHFLIALGINVSNPLPTICLQEVFNRACPNSNPVSVAKVIATVLSRLERLIDRMLYAPKPSGLTWALSLYTQCWMHTNQSVQVRSLDKTPIDCVVIGVDDFGYLRVRDSTNGAEFSLHPDGNSMDMMRGLIVPKTHS
ncbi:hypothetical protein AHF37_05936 [Paragonimus kellicotti]|nr:hypothetical protein AHF37_05936 [Paragonimus kellicotti]